MKIAVSYLKSKDSLEETIQKIDESLADYIHVDLMDGVFVQNKTEDIARHILALQGRKKPLDIHLMMQGEILAKTIDVVSFLKPDCISIHAEVDQVEEMIDKIKEKGIQVGLAISPDTPIFKLRPYFHEIDKIIIMSVYPGRGGQSFLKEVVSKIKLLKEIKEDYQYPFVLEVDGGINQETISDVSELVDVVVSGSYVCMKEDLNEAIKSLK